MSPKGLNTHYQILGRDRARQNQLKLALLTSTCGKSLSYASGSWGRTRLRLNSEAAEAGEAAVGARDAEAEPRHARTVGRERAEGGHGRRGDRVRDVHIADGMHQLLEGLVHGVRDVDVHLASYGHGNLHRARDRNLVGNVNRDVHVARDRHLAGNLHLHRHRHLHAALHRDLPVLHHRHFHVLVHDLRLDLGDLHLDDLLNWAMLDLWNLHNALDVLDLRHLHFALLLDDHRLMDNAFLDLDLGNLHNALLVLDLGHLNDLLNIFNFRHLILTLLHDGNRDVA